MLKNLAIFCCLLLLSSHAEEVQPPASAVDPPTDVTTPSQVVANAATEAVAPSSDTNEVREVEKEKEKEVEKDSTATASTPSENSDMPSSASDTTNEVVTSAEAPSSSNEKVNEVVSNALAPTEEAQAASSSVLPQESQEEKPSSAEPSEAASPPEVDSSTENPPPPPPPPPLSHLDDDYYGLLQNPADHLDRAAFQPSHTLVLTLDPSETMLLFEDVANMNVGKVVRGSWFVTNGDDVKVTISESSQGSVLYSSSSSSSSEGEQPQKEGSFRFTIPRAGRLTISLENPSSSSRSVSFAWLLGADDDDPFVGKRTAAARQGGGEKEGGGGGGLPSKDGTDNNDANAFTQSMLKRVSTLHKDIDDVTSLQQFADVRFARHLDTVESNKRRLLWWTVAETVVILVSSALHVIVVQHVFDYKGFKRAFV